MNETQTTTEQQNVNVDPLVSDVDIDLLESMTPDDYFIRDLQLVHLCHSHSESRSVKKGNKPKMDGWIRP